MNETTLDQISAAYRQLMNLAVEATANSYAPYSKYQVGAALLPVGGAEPISGVNVENVSYGLTICAERSAIVRAFSMGIREFEAIAVFAKGGEPERIGSPCGACRQFMLEVANLTGRDFDVILANEKLTRIGLSTVSELLPFSMTTDALKID